jgi:hypothetical protein
MFGLPYRLFQSQAQASRSRPHQIPSGKLESPIFVGAIGKFLSVFVDRSGVVEKVMPEMNISLAQGI